MNKSQEIRSAVRECLDSCWTEPFVSVVHCAEAAAERHGLVGEDQATMISILASILPALKVDLHVDEAVLIG